jgi:putative transposase
MSEYRRHRVPGASYFFTVNLEERSSRLLVERIELLRLAVGKVRQRRPFHIDAWVVLPEHMHCVWTMPEGDDDFAGRWRDIKGGFSRSVPMTGVLSESRKRKHEREIWQRRYWEHTIRDDGDFEAHVDYVHFNPVKHGWVKRAIDWPYSSFHRWMDKGIYGADWLGG